MTSRERLSATVEGELLAAGRAAVKAGRADSLSAWVNAALRRQAEHDQRMKALDDFLRAYEAEHGVISGDEIEQASRRARARALVVRTPPSEPPNPVHPVEADTAAKAVKQGKAAKPTKQAKRVEPAEPGRSVGPTRRRKRGAA